MSFESKKGRRCSFRDVSVETAEMLAQQGAKYRALLKEGDLVGAKEVVRGLPVSWERKSEFYRVRTRRAIRQDGFSFIENGRRGIRRDDNSTGRTVQSEMQRLKEEYGSDQ